MRRGVKSERGGAKGWVRLVGVVVAVGVAVGVAVAVAVVVAVVVAVGVVVVVAVGVESMRNRQIPGAREGEALPTGEYAVLIPHVGVETHLGRIPLPPEEVAAGGMGPLYLRVTLNPFRFAGQSHGLTGHSWEWSVADGWVLGGEAFGVSGAIYDRDGVLHLATPDSGIGSQGWRYVEDGTGRLVTGDETYADPARRLWEWTRHGEITVGQGPDSRPGAADGGCLALWDDGYRVRVQAGDARFVRFNRVDDQIAISMALLKEGRHVIWRGTVDELRALPVDASPAPVDPTPMPEGTEVDMLAYMIGEPSAWPRTGSHGMHCMHDPARRLVWFVKFDDPMKYELWRYDDEWLWLHEDHGTDGIGGGRVWGFTRPILRRRMRIGEPLAIPDQGIVRYSGPGVVSQPAVPGSHPMAMTVVQGWHDYDCGGDLGHREVVEIRYDLPGAENHEYLMLAAGAGWWSWAAEYRGRPRQESIFNRVHTITPTPVPFWRPLSGEPEAPDMPRVQTIQIKSKAHGTYVRALDTGEIRCDATTPGPWETFRAIPVGTVWLLVTAHDLAVTLPGALVGVLTPLAQAAGTHEIDPRAGTIRVVDARSGYWSAQPDGSLDANRDAVGPWEEFELLGWQSDPR